jgi:hypothetical protein
LVFTVKGDFKLGNVKIQPAVGLFNGEGQNKLDVNEPMDFVGRLVVKPIEALHLVWLTIMAKLVVLRWTIFVLAEK